MDDDTFSLKKAKDSLGGNPMPGLEESIDSLGGTPGGPPLKSYVDSLCQRKETQVQYIIPILAENEEKETWGKIHMYTQPLMCLYDQHGNLKNCIFSKREEKEIGTFYLFRALDQQVAETVYDVLSNVKELTVLPIRKVEVE